MLAKKVDTLTRAMEVEAKKMRREVTAMEKEVAAIRGEKEQDNRAKRHGSYKGPVNGSQLLFGRVLKIVLLGMAGNTIRISGFPSQTTADGVKSFLEKYAGDGSIVALKLRVGKGATRRMYAIVQFSKRATAQEIFFMLEQNSALFSDGSYLKVREAERDIVPKPREYLLVLENIRLYSGCPLSEEKFSALWSTIGTKVEFGFNLRKINFFLSHEAQSYMLELSYESIWGIKRYSVHTEYIQFLLFQVVAAPKIYVSVQRSLDSDSINEDPIFNYFRDISHDQWVRTTDFTPSCSIGQSSALCLKLPYNYSLPNMREYFSNYSEAEVSLKLYRGYSYSSRLDLVPIVEPNIGIVVPYKILFEINHLVQNGALIGPTLDSSFYKLVSPFNTPLNYIERALAMISNLEVSCYSPARWLQEQYIKFEQLKYSPKSPSISLVEGLVYVHRVHITPAKVYFYGPEINVSNRVLRHYSRYIDNFVRVSFVDEDGERLRSMDISSRSLKHNDLYWRILSTLQNGITVANRKFEFLAFSSSQLRENSVWMFASINEITAAHIRRSMGDFSKIRNVAKYSARLGQSFGSSIETLTVDSHEVDIIPDIENFGYVFSDGIGKISTEFANRVAAKCGVRSSTPSAFQIRYGGYKGVVAIDPTSTKKLSLRRSMCKFDSKNTKLDVLAYSKYQPCFLNRQVITLLSTLGVADYVFEGKQKEAVKQLDGILTDPVMALEALELMSLGETTNILKELLSCGYKPDTEPFLSMLLQTFRESRLSELRMKARIFVPKGRGLMGCLDETSSLEYGQVFVQVSCSGNSSFHDDGQTSLSGHHTVVLNCKVIVAKNPCLHPGDIRVLSAVDIPELHHMVDCVVFPKKGKRPHPNECSGSDLDGDIYFVSWDSSLIPPRVANPMDYTPAPAITLEHDVKIEEVMKYFTDYIVNDSLGTIANAHTVFADREPLKAFSDPCIELSKLFSIAVDFPKTGVPAEIPNGLYPKEYPDFMEKLDNQTYESKGVIGKLFRAIKDHIPESSCVKEFTKQVARRCYDPDMEVDGFREYLDEAFFFKGEYDFKLGNLMENYGIKTEAEILSGSITKMSKRFTKYKDGEAIRRAVRSVRKEARTWFDENANSTLDADDDAYAKASAWYHVTYHPDYWKCCNEGLNRPHFLSFAWCVYDKLIIIKQRKNNMRKIGARISLLNERMKRSLTLD